MGKMGASKIIRGNVRRAQGKILPREPGEAFGVLAYSAALGWARGVAADSKTPKKRRNTRVLQTLRDFCNAGTNAVSSVGAA